MSKVNQGLEGVVVATTKVSNVDGVRGELVYAGYLLEELIERQCSYEDVLYLLLKNKLPTPKESIDFTASLASRRTLSPQLEAMIDAMPRDLDYIDALRTGISALSCEMDVSYPPNEEQALNCIAKAPLILSRYHRLKTNQPVLASNPKLSHVANYLYLLTGKDPDTVNNKAYAKALETYFITTIEHGMNASTFGARVATSTQSDLISSVTAALSVLKGPLHGGAPSEVIHMLDAIGSKENAEAWIRKELKEGRRIMGFGHRVYKTKDPRANALLEAVKALPSDDHNAHLELSRHVEQAAIKVLQELKPNKNLYTNVEFGAAAVLRAVGLPEALYPATFGLSRCGGWAAHILELSQSNRLIRPASEYTGAWPQKILDRKNQRKDTNHATFLMKMMAHPATKIASIIMMMAGVALFGLMMAGLGYLSLSLGYSLAATSFAVGAGFFAGNRMIAERTAKQEPLNAVTP